MNKYNNPRLTNTTIAGSGMKHPVRPHVILGNPENGYIQGDILDANAVKEIAKESVNDIVDGAPEALNTLKELADAIQENGVADLVTKGLLETALTDKVDKSDMVESDANGHDYVEIGGIRWATMNIGANSVTDAGLYFQWGDIQGYTADLVGNGEGQKYFWWEDYKYGNGTSSPGAAGMTKYNATDGKTVLEAADDAVIANWGGDWRMPTAEELQALSNAVNTTWTDDYQGSGVKGLVFTDKNDNSKVLFFPAAGLCAKGRVLLVGGDCYARSSSLSAKGKQFATAFFSRYSDAYFNSDSNRCYGYAVRGVLGVRDKYATKALVEQLQSNLEARVAALEQAAQS